MLTNLDTKELIAHLESSLPFIVYNPSAFYKYHGVTPMEASHRFEITKINSAGDYYQIFVCSLFFPSGQRDSNAGKQRTYKLCRNGSTWICTAVTELDVPPTDQYASEKDKNIPDIDAAVISAVNAYTSKA